MKKILLIATILGSFSPFAHADQCSEWTWKEHPVTFQTCSNRDGGSGYIVISNEGRRTADICWTVHANDGTKSRGCHSSMPAGEKERISCSDCGSKRAGIREIQLREYTPK